jgi:hypothetical protein
MNCVAFSKAFRDNMSTLGIPAQSSLLSSLPAALTSLMSAVQFRASRIGWRAAGS